MTPSLQSLIEMSVEAFIDVTSVSCNTLLRQSGVLASTWHRPAGMSVLDQLVVSEFYNLGPRFLPVVLPSCQIAGKPGVLEVVAWKDAKLHMVIYSQEPQA